MTEEEKDFKKQKDYFHYLFIVILKFIFHKKMLSNASINEFGVKMLTHDHKILICNNDICVDKNYIGLLLRNKKQLSRCCLADNF